MKMLKESSSMAYDVVYTNSMADMVVTIDSRNNDVKKIEKEVESYFKSLPDGSDDFWVEDVIPKKNSPDIDKDIFTAKGGRLNQDVIDMLFDSDGDDISLKLKFLFALGYSIKEIFDRDLLEDVQVWGQDNDTEDDGFGGYVPTDFAEEVLQMSEDSLYSALDNSGMLYLFDIGKFVGTQKVNGVVDYDWIDNNFIVMWV